MKSEMHLWSLEKIVLAAGGKWVGVQRAPVSSVLDQPDLVLFNSERTGSTLALPDDEFFTVAAVREKIYLSDKTFEDTPVRIPRGSLQDMIEELEGIARALKVYMENK